MIYKWLMFILLLGFASRNIKAQEIIHTEDSLYTLSQPLPVFYDASRKMDFQTILSQEFKVDSAYANHIYTKHWNKFKIQNQIDARFLILFYGRSDSVSVFIPNKNGSYSQKLCGNLVRKNINEHNYEKSILQLETDSIDFNRFFYFSRSPATVMAKINLRKPITFTFSDSNDGYKIGLPNDQNNHEFFLGLVLMSILILTLNSILLKEFSFLLYSFYLADVFLMFAIHSPNIHNLLIKFHSYGHEIAIASCHFLGIIFYTLFTTNYLKVNKKSPRLFLYLHISILLVFVLGVAAIIVSIAFPYNRWIVPSMIIFEICFSLFAMFALIKVYLLSESRFERYVIYGASILLLGNALVAFFSNSIYFMIAVVLETILLMVVLVSQNKLNLKQKLHNQLLLDQERMRSENLSRLDHMKSQFHSNISHEFRTPLTIISGLSKQLVDQPGLGKNQVKTANTIYQNSLQLAHLTDQILDLNKIDNHKMVLLNESGNIINFITEYLKRFQDIIKSNNQELLIHSTSDELIMDFDQEKLQYVINNLLSNAIKFTPPNGKLSIYLSQKEQDFAIKVKDTGLGIDEPDLEKIFKRHYTTYDAYGKKGVGIGLALTRELIEIMKGTIFVQSEINQGTVFTVLLPITSAAPTLAKYKFIPPYITKQSLAIEIEEDEKSKMKILVVEDNQDIYYYLNNILRNKYLLRYAENGEVGLSMLRKHTIDFIISDIVMPIMDGYQFCKEVKKNIETSHLPFILLSAKHLPMDKKKAYALGIDSYLTKPFDPEELNAIIDNLLRKRAEMREDFSKILDIKSTHYEQKILEQIDIDFIKKLQLLALSESEKYAVNDLPKKLGMSRTAIHNKIKVLTGMSTTQYLNHIRLEKSEKLLLETNLNVSEIAFQLGFDVPHFNRLFKKKYHTTPSQFRKKQQFL